MRKLLIQVLLWAFAGGLAAQDLPAPYITAEALESDLQSLYEWVNMLHPRHDVLDSAAFVGIAGRFPSGAPTFFVAAAVDEALRPLADEHTSVNMGLWSSLVAKEHGVWEGRVEVVNEAGELRWFDASGLEVDSLYGQSVAALSPAALLQSLWPGYHPATRANQVAEMGPIWAPFLATAEGESPHPSGSTLESIRWNWDEDSRTFRITVPTFTAGTDDEFEGRMAQLREAMESASEAGVDAWEVDLRGNEGGKKLRAMMLAGLFTDQPVSFHHSVHFQGSQALRDWGRGQVPWWKRPFVTGYDRAILRTKPGELSAIRAYVLPASDRVVPTGAEIRVFVDGVTGSAAAACAWWLKNEQNARLIGIPPTAQIHAVCGNTLTAILPKSGIPVRMATTCWTDSPSLFPAQVAMPVDSMVFPEASPMEKLQSDHPREHAFLLGLMAELKPLIADAGNFERLAAPLVLACAIQLEQLNDEQEKLEGLPVGATTESGVEPAAAMNEVLRLKKEAVDQRNAALRLLVPMHLWPTMNAWLNPEKPAVLHFGLHDRMNCNVCKPE